MTLREGVCSNRPSAVIWGEGIWPNHHITFLVAEKAFTTLLALFTVYVGEGVGWKRHMGGRGLAENVRIPLYGERGV